MSGPPPTDRPDALTARWVLPVCGPPVRGGTVELRRDGTIAAVHDRPDARGGAVDLGDATLLPGFVNAHIHLEFSDFRTPIPADDTFADWIAATVAARRSSPGDASGVMARVRRGLAESLAAGVTTVGEIAAAGWDAAGLPPPGGRPNLVAFGELIAPRDPAAALAAGRDFFHADCDPPGLVRGLSPHAPYSVHPALPALLVADPITAAAPLAVHLLETREEEELLRSGTGPMAAAMARLNATRGDFGADRLRQDFLHPLGAAARGLIVHGNFLARRDIDWLADERRRRLSVVYCPRTHAHFRHPSHPWRDLRAAGVRVAVGTDGRGSNPDLSVLHELRFLRRRFPDVPPATLLRLGTLDAADALGSPAGRLAAGRPADLCAIRSSEDTGDPAADLLADGAAVAGAAVAGVWVDGRSDR